MTVRKMTSGRTRALDQMPVKLTSTVGKNRRKIVADCIDLHDLGCHAFKDGSIPKGRSVMRHNLSPNVRTF